MAVSWRIVITVVALAVFSFIYISLDPVIIDVIDPMAADHAESAPAQTNYSRVSEMWRLAPVFATIAAAAFLLREALWVRGGAR